MNKETFSKALDKTDEKYISELTEHINTHLPRKGLSPFIKYGSIAAGAFIALSTAAIAVVIGTGTPGTGMVYSESLNNTSVQPPETEVTSSSLPESSAPAQSSIEISEPETYAELFMEESYFKGKVRNIAFGICTSSMTVDGYHIDPMQNYYYSIITEDPDIEYLYPYQKRIYNAFQLIDGYARQNGFVPQAKAEEYLGTLSEKEESSDIGSYCDPWSYAQEFGLKYSDFKDMLSETGDFTEDEAKLIFEGTREQFIEKFINRYTLYIDGMVYTPKVCMEDKRLYHLIDEDILPDMLFEKRDAALEDYPDSPWAAYFDEWLTIYTKLFEAAYDDYKGNKDYSRKEFVSEYLPSCLKPISDTPVFDETIETVKLTDEQKDIVEKVYDEYVKMACLFFNESWEDKNSPPVFEGTEYEFEKAYFNEDELPDELKALCEDELYPKVFIKYTGSAVNTLEKLREARSQYFTDHFVQKLIDTMFSEPLEPKYTYTWEADGGAYRFCFDDGNGAFYNLFDYYIVGFSQTDDKIEINVAADPSRMYESYDNHYTYIHCNIILELNEDGSFRIDDMEWGRYHISDQPEVRIGYMGSVTAVYQPGEFMPDGMCINNFYKGGILHFD
ncbi:MAG: hypothetical protein J1E39_08500 [Eubacterium sp.]|nr:hypothetical protein [Eubacterium sp.]